MTPTPNQAAIGAEQAIREALEQFPKGWHTVFHQVREREPGVVEIGALWEDSDSLAEVITVDTGNYYDNAAAMPMARFIAACNPANITALLAQLEDQRAVSARVEADARRWIKTEERMPRPEVSVLGFWPPSSGPVHAGCFSTVCLSIAGIWCNPEDDENDYIQPTFWMPLPKAPNLAIDAAAKANGSEQ